MGGVIAEIGLGVAELPLEATIAASDRIRCRVERITATESARLTVFLRVEGPDLTGIEDAFESDETVDQVRLITDLGDERVYRMEWTRRIDPLAHALREEQGAVLSARGTDDGWRLRLLFSTREELSRIHDNWRTNGIEIEVHSLHDADRGSRDRFDLTTDRERTLLATRERDYYEVPREMGLETLASEFEISPQTLSERLQRTHGSSVNTP